jgi:hypothetical protein
MANLTGGTDLTGLTQAVKHFNNPIADGVADTIVTVAPFYEVIPFRPIAGQSLIVNQDATTGMVKFAAEGLDLANDDTVSKPMSTTQRTFTLKALLGQANVDRFAQAVSPAGVDQMALQVASKSRNIARKAYAQVALGTTLTGGDSDGFAGMYEIGQTTNSNSTSIVDASSTASNVFDLFDQMKDLVTSKDGQVDFIMCSSNVLNIFKKAVRTVGAGFDYFTSPITNRTVLAYEGTPIYTNNHLKGVDIATDTEALFAGNFEDGGNNGVAMIYPDGTPAGIDVRPLGESELYNSDMTRVAMYTSLAVYNDKGLSVGKCKVA